MLAPRIKILDPDKLPLDKMPVDHLVDVLPLNSLLGVALRSGPATSSVPPVVSSEPDTIGLLGIASDPGL
jgi:hypothetical protein